MARCYVCNAEPSDPCKAVDGEVAECPRPSRRQVAATTPAAFWEMLVSQEAQRKQARAVRVPRSNRRVAENDEPERSLVQIQEEAQAEARQIMRGVKS
jgi:hypothetical protein